MFPQFLAVMTALVASLSLTPVARKLAVHMGAVDLPGPRKGHLTSIPLPRGLAVYAVAAAFFLVLAVTGGQTLVATLAAAVLGAALGFLRWNFAPARIFMGDGGAMFLGFMMATVGLKLRVGSQPLGAIIPVFVLAVPI